MLSHNINFNLEALKDTEEGYEKVNPTIEETKIINEISRFLSQNIRLSNSITKAITWNAIREWQIRNNKNVAYIRELSIGKRLNAIKEMFCIGNKMLKTMLKQPKDKSEIIIDIAFEKAFKLFLNYSYKNNYD
ncbi:MAG: hypothetical protein ACFFC3_06595 [Candidatus Odinarchaeota archaeon]